MKVNPIFEQLMTLILMNEGFACCLAAIASERVEAFMKAVEHFRKSSAEKYAISCLRPSSDEYDREDLQWLDLALSFPLDRSILILNLSAASNEVFLEYFSELSNQRRKFEDKAISLIVLGGEGVGKLLVPRLYDMMPGLTFFQL